MLLDLVEHIVTDEISTSTTSAGFAIRRPAPPVIPKQ
jgi:hypothetical protein